MFEEIEFIKREVLNLPLNKNNHRRYPALVKSTALKLIAQGMSTNKMSITTGIHPTTLLYWQSGKKSCQKFKELKIKSEPKLEISEKPELHFASGARALGLRFSEFAELLKKGLIR